jgi:hypothetical protein
MLQTVLLFGHAPTCTHTHVDLPCAVELFMPDLVIGKGRHIYTTYAYAWNFEWL